MNKRQVPGWAVIFAVTILLVACATHEAQVANTYKMAGADATVAQFDAQHEDSAIFVSQDWLDEREVLVEQRELDLELQANALAIQEAWQSEHALRLDRESAHLERQDNSLAMQQAWFREHDKQLALQGAIGSSAAQLVGAGNQPKNAEPGHCYARVLVPGEYLTVTDKVLSESARMKVDIVPARYETVSEQVMVEKGSLQLKVIPAEYGFVTERVMVEPARKRLVHAPAQYEIINERVMVKPASAAWKQGAGPMQKVDGATGEILCLVETPAQYQSVAKSVLKTPSSTHEVEDPPVYKTIKRRVITTPARTEMVDVPAKYKTVQVTKMIEPAHEKQTPIAAQFQTVTKQIKVTEDRTDWQEILCETNLTHDKIGFIQKSLDWFGFKPGPIDGVLGPQTMAAVKAFQKDHGLTVANYLTVDTVEALGVEL